MLVGKPEGKRLFGRPRHRRDDNIMMKSDKMILCILNSGKWQVAEHGLHNIQGHFVTRWLCFRELMCFVATVT